MDHEKRLLILSIQGGHYMRPDLLRLVVDTDRKSLVSKVDGSGKYIVEKTIDRVGLSTPFKDLPIAQKFETNFTPAQSE
jgi:cyanide hydratase